jgi:hypothetical protein
LRYRGKRQGRPRLALDAPVDGSASFIIAAADTVMTRPSADLMREVLPGTELRGEISGNATLLSIDRAARVLGFGPAHSWAGSRQRVGPDPGLGLATKRADCRIGACDRATMR